MRVEIQDGKYIRMIGEIIEGIFYKKIKGSKHIYRKLDGIGIDALTFDGIILHKCAAIRILDTETGVIYWTKPSTMKQRGEYRHHKPHRAQIIMSRNFWMKEDA